MSAVVLRELDFVGGMGVTAVRHLNDSLELMRFRNIILGFEVFIPDPKSESPPEFVQLDTVPMYKVHTGAGVQDVD